MPYVVELSTLAEKQFHSVSKKDRGRIEKQIDQLATIPVPHNAKKLTGEVDLYRIRSGDYRIVYRFKSGVLTITVIRVQHRRDVYRDL